MLLIRAQLKLRCSTKSFNHESLLTWTSLEAEDVAFGGPPAFRADMTRHLFHGQFSSLQADALVFKIFVTKQV